jgi:hypothetical protein
VSVKRLTEEGKPKKASNRCVTFGILFLPKSSTDSELEVCLESGDRHHRVIGKIKKKQSHPCGWLFYWSKK